MTFHEKDINNVYGIPETLEEKDTHTKQNEKTLRMKFYSTLRLLVSKFHSKMVTMKLTIRVCLQKT